MNKKILVSACVCMIFMTGCGNTSGNISSKDQSQNQVVQENSTDQVSDLEQIIPENNSVKNSASGTEGVDIDLTMLSSTMVYAEVYNIMVMPENYIGKNIRIDGDYYKSYYEKTQQDYHFILITDALACCQSGIEFRIDDDSLSYPLDGSNVEITGTFESYEELGQTYYFLNVTQL